MTNKSVNNYCMLLAVNDFIQRLVIRAKNPAQLHPDTFEAFWKQKFIQVMRTYHGTDSKLDAINSVYCFIEIATGNILKANSPKAPTLRNPRGNVFFSNPLSGTNSYGVDSVINMLYTIPVTKINIQTDYEQYKKLGIIHNLVVKSPVPKDEDIRVLGLAEVELLFWYGNLTHDTMIKLNALHKKYKVL